MESKEVVGVPAAEPDTTEADTANGNKADEAELFTGPSLMDDEEDDDDIMPKDTNSNGRADRNPVPDTEESGFAESCAAVSDVEPSLPDRQRQNIQPEKSDVELKDISGVPVSTAEEKKGDMPIKEISENDQIEPKQSEKGGDDNMDTTCVKEDADIEIAKSNGPAEWGEEDKHAESQTMDKKDEKVPMEDNIESANNDNIKEDDNKSTGDEQTSEVEEPQPVADEGRGGDGEQPSELEEPESMVDEPKENENEQALGIEETQPAAAEGKENYSQIKKEGLDREILFDDKVINIQAFDDGSIDARKKVQGWTNQQWNAASNKKMSFMAPVLRVTSGRYFWSSDIYEKRVLAIYNNPDVILIMRLPSDMDEVHRLSKDGGQEISEKDLNRFLVAESVADPKTCKIRLSQLTNATSIPSKDSSQHGGQGIRNSMNIPKKIDYRRRSCFDILTPTETVTLSAAFLPADSFEDIEYTSEKALNDTHRCEDAIVSTLLSAHSLGDSLCGGSDQAWRHQFVLGTPHSYVLSGSDKTLQESLASALEFRRSRDENTSGKLDSNILDTKDDSGKTALHYACNRRKNSTIQILVLAGADCSIPQNGDEFTPCHICAKSLDEKCLSIILAASYPSRPDPNALDSEGRTPMYLAAVEGKGINGNSDAIALERCILALDAWGGQLMVDSPKCKGLMHPVHLISAKWKFQELSVVLSHSKCRYPLTLGPSDAVGISLSAKFHYPIHAALVSLRDAIAKSVEGDSDCVFNAEFMPIEPPLVKTLQTLLQHGFEPNERFEGVIGEGDAFKSFSCYFGFSPLQILALSAADARAIEIKEQESGYNNADKVRSLRNITKVIQACAELLLKNGARINLPPPPWTRLDRLTPTGCYSLKDALEDHNASMQVGHHEADWLSHRLKIDGNGEYSALLGGSKRMKTCQKEFTAMGKSIQNSGGLEIGSSPTLDSAAPGGSDTLSCAICWSEFGVISNRKHLCRVSRRHVCNECSSKRLIDNGSEQRVSDGQYLLACAEASNTAAKSRADRAEQMQKQRQSVTQARKSLGLKANSGSASSTDAEDTAKLSTKDKITNAIAGLGQTKDAVLERGDKLESLADKTEALNQASLDFANMAKELNRSQNSWW